jgi:uroporphyrinogen-III decarboxylase
MELEAPDIETTYPFSDVIKRLDEVEKEVGRENMFNAYDNVNFQGPLNIAVKLRGQQFFIDLIEKPDIARKILDVSTRTIEKVLDYLRQRLGIIRWRPDYGYCIAHCPILMISPAMYETFILPYENRLASKTEYLTGRRGVFELHHCTSVIDPYINTYKKVDQLSKIDGAHLDTDFRRVKRELPNVRIDVGLDSFRVMVQNMDQFLADVYRFIDGGVARISWEITPEIADGKVFEFLKAVKAI